MMRTLIGILAALALFLLPGAWVAFGLSASGVSFRARLACSVVLSPLIVTLQFYGFRWMGLGFASTAIAVTLLNVPALILVYRRRPDVRIPPASVVLGWCACLVLPASYLLVWMRDAQVRANWGHAWTHADAIYMLANGELRPEEPLLAGVRLAYPWFGHVYQGTLSFLLGSSPNSNYLLTDVVWLLATIVFVAEVVARLGGGRIAQMVSSIWMCFAVNFVGSVGRRVVSAAFASRYPVWGDDRYSPWLRKFGVFNQNVLGIGAFAALLLVLTEVDEESPTASSLILTGLFLITQATFYPILLPASAAIVGGRMLMLLTRRFRASRLPVTREFALLALCLVVTAAIAVGHVALVTTDRTSRALELSDLWSMKVKTATAFVVLLPLLPGALIVGRSLWRLTPARSGVMVLGAIASLVLFVALNIHAPNNEYKFVFTAAVCLTPFTSVFAERLLPRSATKALPLALLCGCVLALPALLNLRGPPDEVGQPHVNTSRFDFRLASTEMAAELADAVRTRAPKSAVLVARWMPFDWTAVTRRPLYVPPHVSFLQGVGFAPDFMLEEVRGYRADVVERRRATVKRLYQAPDSVERARALRDIFREIPRPIVAIARLPEDAELATWIGLRADARAVYSGRSLAAWVVNNPTGATDRRVPESSARF